FLNVAPLFLGIIAAIVLEERVKWKWLRTAFIIAAIIPTIVGSLLWTFGNLPYGPGPQYVSQAELDAFSWINANTPVDSVFMTCPMLLLGEPLTFGTGGTRVAMNHPLPTFTGRRVVLGSDVFSSLYSPEVDHNVLYDRLAFIEAVYNGTAEPGSLDRFSVNYISYGPQEREKWPNVSFNLPVVYDYQNITVYRLK
ncbi:MAG: hypothetical protein V1887_00240, partial [Candidatus Aenigmatarchaeota archaeon]